MRSYQSIYELAEEMNVSPSTVSRVLNQRGGIGEATRQKVLAAARRTGFRPRTTVRQHTVAIVVDRSQFSTFGGFVSTIVAQLMQVISQEGLIVELVSERSFARLHDHLVDGVLALAWDDATIAELRTLPDIPVVTINRMDVPDFSAVATNHLQQAQKAVTYLHGRGHRRIAMLGEERNNWGSQQRVEGFTQAMTTAGLPVDDHAIVFTDHQPMYGVLRRLVSGYNPTAIFVAGEDMALEASYILRDVLGLKIPHDISLLGMESPKVSQFLAPPMTTLSQPLDQVAAMALQVLKERMGKGRGTAQRIMLDNSLIERESVATYTGPVV